MEAETAAHAAQPAGGKQALPNEPVKPSSRPSADIAVRGAPTQEGQPAAAKPAALPSSESNFPKGMAPAVQTMASALSTGSSEAMTQSSSGSVSNPSPFAASLVPFGDSSSESEDEGTNTAGALPDTFAFQAPQPPNLPAPCQQDPPSLTFVTSAKVMERAPTPPLPGQPQFSQASLVISTQPPESMPVPNPMSPRVASSPFSTAPGPAFDPTPLQVATGSDSPATSGSEDPGYPTSRAGSLVAGPPGKRSPRSSSDVNPPMTVKEMAKLQAAGWQAAEQANRQDRISARLSDSVVEPPHGEAASAPQSIQRVGQHSQSQPEGRALASSAPMSTPMRGSLSGLSRSATYGRRGSGRAGMASAPSSRAPGAAARQQSRTISQMLVDGVIADEGMHLEGEQAAHASGTSLDLKMLSRRNCPSLHLGDPPATVAAAVGSLQHVRLDNERLTDLNRGLLERLTAAISLSLASNQLVSALDLGVLPSLRMLDMSHNHLTQVQGLRALTQLVALDLSHNKLLAVEPISLPSSIRFLQLAGNPVTQAHSSLGSVLAANLPMLRMIDGVPLARPIPYQQEAELIGIESSKSAPGSGTVDTQELTRNAKSASLGNAPGFKRPPISPVRGSSSRKHLHSSDSNSEGSPSPTSSRAPLQDSAQADAAVLASSFPERLDASLDFPTRMSAAVKYLANQRPSLCKTGGHGVQPWPAAAAIRQHLAEVLPKASGMQDESSGEAPDYLTRQLETYLKLGGREESGDGAARSMAMNPMMTATVIRARMALAQAVPKMLAAAKEARVAELQLPSGPGTSMQALLREQPVLAERLQMRAGEGSFLGTGHGARMPTPQAVLASLEALTSPPLRMSASGEKQPGSGL